MPVSPELIRHGMPKSELPFTDRPDVADMREGINIWFFEENGDFGVPRLAIDAVGATWDQRFIGANFAFPDGRVLDGAKTVPATSLFDEEGKPTVIGSTVLSFRCIEPFGTWHLSYDDEIVDTTADAQIAGKIDPSKNARIRIEADISLQIPVWKQVYADDDDSAEAGWMGRGWRYETPVRIEGTFEIDGKSRPFKGTGELVRRQSRRSTYGSFPGHSWQAAIFPSGKAFGCNVYPDVEGNPPFNMGYVYVDGVYHDAKVIEAPWLKQMVAKGDDCTVVLESALGQHRIAGTTLLSTFKPFFKSMGGLCLQQGGVRFTWDGETAIGMTERSASLA